MDASVSIAILILLLGFLFELFYFQVKKRTISKRAIEKSIDVISGKVTETFAPLLKFDEYGINPKDARFLGSPIDFVVFDGLHSNNPKQIVFIEIKHGKSQLSPIQKKIKNLIEEKKVKWIEIRI